MVCAVQKDALLKLDELGVVWCWSHKELVTFCEGYDLLAKLDEQAVLDMNLIANIMTRGPG